MAWLPVALRQRIMCCGCWRWEWSPQVEFFQKHPSIFFPSENISFFQNEIMIKAIKAMTSDFFMEFLWIFPSFQDLSTHLPLFYSATRPRKSHQSVPVHLADLPQTSRLRRFSAFVLGECARPEPQTIRALGEALREEFCTETWRIFDGEREWVYLSICLSVCLSICLSVYLSIYLSIWVNFNDLTATSLRPHWNDG